MMALFLWGKAESALSGAGGFSWSWRFFMDVEDTFLILEETKFAYC
jgi:hypothetical protein